MTKRCVFCGNKLDEKGRCQNTDCPDYIRTKIIEEAEKAGSAKDIGTSSTKN